MYVAVYVVLGHIYDEYTNSHGTVYEAIRMHGVDHLLVKMMR